jgi:predicted secreted protein
MHHKISGDNNNKNIVVHKGDTIEIQLDETPTTGYSWEIDNIDSHILDFQSSDYKMYTTAGIGGGGIRSMKFLVNGHGNGFIKLKNWRKWNGDIYQQFEIDVNAQ